jgi:hypothetical protein
VSAGPKPRALCRRRRSQADFSHQRSLLVVLVALIVLAITRDLAQQKPHGFQQIECQRSARLIALLKL